MSSEKLNRKYFSKETRGYNIISRYYYKYYDLFKRTIFPDFNDFINQIFLNISRINFSEEIKSLEAYIIGTIKIQCRVQLDKALKAKNLIPESRLKKNDEDEETVIYRIPGKEGSPSEIFELQEMFVHLNLFKLQIKKSDAILLNHLIEGKERKEIANEMQINLNTLDTNIRRLRIKLVDYFKKLGYSSHMFDKFEK